MMSGGIAGGRWGGVLHARGRAPRAALAVTLAGALALQGCATIPAGVDANDPCSVNRQPLVEAQQRYNETIAVGAVSGALAGALIGGLATGDLSGALIGGAIGAAGGALGGYLQAKNQQAQSRAEVIDAINQDVRSSRGYVTRIGEGIRRLNTCRANEVADLRRRIQQGMVGGDAAQAELALLRTRIADDRRLVNAVIGEVDENRGVFADALAKTQGVERDMVVSASAQSYQPVVRGGGGGSGGGIVRGMASSGGETRFATAGVNVRSGPGTQHARIGTFGEGQRVGLLGDAGGGWSRVAAGSGEGYVATRFLSSSPPRTAQGGGGAVSVPTVDARRAPKPKNDIEALYIEASNIKAEDAAFENQIGQELDALEALAQ